MKKAHILQFLNIFQNSTRKIFTILFTIIATTTYSDPLAADATAARYRTGVPEVIISSVPDHIQKGVFSDPDRFLPELTGFLRSGTDDKFLIVKRFNDWIVDNIAYDSDLFYGLATSTSQKPTAVLPNKRTTCGGFANLFKEMCRLSDIECVYIRGSSRGYRTEKGPSGHAWNAVKINNKWYIVDVTANNRMGYFQKKFSDKRKYHNTSLFIHPDAKILINYPDNPEYKFTDKAISLDDFLNSPSFSIFGIKYNIEFKTDIGSLISRDSFPLVGGRQQTIKDVIKTNRNTISIEVAAPSTVRFTASIKPLDTSRFDEFEEMAAIADEEINYSLHSHFYKENSGYFFNFSAPSKGLFRVNISARFTDRDDNFQTIYSFVISESSGQGEILPKQNILYKQHYFEAYGLEILSDNLLSINKDGYYSIHLKTPENILTFASVRDRKNKTIPGMTYKNHPPGYIEYLFKIPDTGEHLIKIHAKRDGEPNYNTALELRPTNISKNSNHFPPTNRLYFKEGFNKNGFTLEQTNISPKNNQSDIYTVNIKAQPDYLVSGGVYGADSKNQTDHFIRDIDGDSYNLYFTQPMVGQIYHAKIFQIDNQKKYNTIAEFYLDSKQAGNKLPLPGMFCRQPLFKTYNMKILSENITVDDKSNYFHIQVDRGEALFLSTTALDNNNKSIPENYSYSSEQDGIYNFHYSSNNSSSNNSDDWLGKIYAAGEDGKMSTAAIFKPQTNIIKKTPLPPQGKLSLLNNFYTYECRLISENLLKTDEFSEITISLQPEYTLRCSLQDDAGKHYSKEFFLDSLPDNKWLIRLNRQPNNGRVLKIFIKNSEGKSYLVGKYRI